MPITAKLSRTFYDKLGDDAANELVEWLNDVDAGYRTELRELNDTNFGRLDARMDMLRAEWRGELTALRGELRGELKSLEARFSDQLANSEKRLVGWMFAFWIGSWAAVIGSLIALRQLGLPGR